MTARFIVDFAGSAPATRGPVNMPFGATIAMCKVVLKALTSPNQPSNAGTTVPLEVRAEPGTLFHAVYPAPTFTLWTGIVALELIYKALAQGMPDRLPASSGGDVPGFMMVGTHPDTGEFFAISNNDAVGWGAAPDHDGIDATIHISESIVRNTPIEVLEARTRDALRAARDPRRLRWRRAASAAAAALRRDIVFDCDGEFLSVIKKTKSRAVGAGRRSLTGSQPVIAFPGTDRERVISTERLTVRPATGSACSPPAAAATATRPSATPPPSATTSLEGYVTARAAAGTRTHGYDVEGRRRAIDGATVEVVRSYLVAAAEEMRATLIRTAFNPVIYEVLDFGISIYDASPPPGGRSARTHPLPRGQRLLVRARGSSTSGWASCIAVTWCC